MRVIGVGRSFFLADEPVYVADGELLGASIGQLVDCWQKHHGDPATTLVGKNAAKHLKAICKQNGIRSKDHS